MKRIASIARGLALAAMLAAPAAGWAKIDLVTLPGRDTTQLSIYKAVDLTLVRETRTLTLDGGRNEIQFSWANTLIDPTSLQIRLVKADPNFTLLDAHYPANTQNTIVWTIEAKQEGMAQVEITCFASGLSWSADYKAIANVAETELRLFPNFTITNSSGEDFENARTRLVVGEVNLVETIAELARRGLIASRDRERYVREVAKRAMVAKDELRMGVPMAAAALADMPMEAKEIIKAAVSEYYLYSIAGTETIETGWGKQLPDPMIDGIPIEVSYEYDPNKYGSVVVKFYKFKNDKAHEMGAQPMPAGTFYIYSDVARGGQRFQARWENKYVPLGEDVELNLGSDGQTLVEERTMSVSRPREKFDYDSTGNVIGWEEVTERELEIRNSQEREVPVKVRQYFGGDWTIVQTTDDFKLVDQATAEWNVRVPPLSKKVLRFTVVERKGSRAKR